MPRVPVNIRLLLPLLVATVLLTLAGCTEDGRQSYATETDEPFYRQAEQMKRANRPPEALSAYLKVIEKRGDDAPESHLEAGLIYLYHIRDPIAAIYHFRKYLALRPNTTQAALVRQRIDAAIRDFAKTLPAQPVESQFQRVDLIAALDKLKLENDLLKQQLADQPAGRVAGDLGMESGQRTSADAGAAANNLSLSVDTLPTVRTRPPRQETPKAAVRQPSQSQPKTTANPGPGTRRHTVRPGDTLSKLSQQYYGSRTRWRDIYQANRGLMRNDSDLKVGMELVIPQ